MSHILEKSAENLKINAGEHRQTSGEGSVVSVKRDIVDEGALLRKMDLQFIPWLSFLYFLSFLDRTSIGNAKPSVVIELNEGISRL